MNETSQETNTLKLERLVQAIPDSRDRYAIAEALRERIWNQNSALVRVQAERPGLFNEVDFDIPRLRRLYDLFDETT